jgi:hypothetical protein
LEWQKDGENCVMMSLVTFTLGQMNDEVKEDEMIKACSKYTRERRRMRTRFRWENQRERDH